jgi:Xaa-Pro dipeptidase
MMRRAARISGEAHMALMKAVKSTNTEYELHALFEYECSKKLGKHQAYTPIVAGGRNGAVLHYVENDAVLPLDRRDLVLVDAACEFHCYASDITRTYPIGGVFSDEYKVVYEIVLKCQKAVLKELKEGVQWEDMHRLAASVILDGLIEVCLMIPCSTMAFLKQIVGQISCWKQGRIDQEPYCSALLSTWIGSSHRT